MMEEGLRKVGEFVVESEALVVSDPGYEPGEWCAAQAAAANGVWDVYVEIEECGALGRRVGRLRASRRGRSPRLRPELWGEVGVDSGRLCVSDEGRFRDDAGAADLAAALAAQLRAVGRADAAQVVETAAEIDGAWAAAAWGRTLGERLHGALPGGYVVGSGYGDGSYELTLWRSEAGLVEALDVDFGL